MKRLLYTFLITLSMAASAQNFTRYYANECEYQPQEILVGPAGLTFINFIYGTVDPGQLFSPGTDVNKQASGEQQQASLDAPQVARLPFEAIHDEGTGLINLSAHVNFGTTDMTVWVGGKACSFVLRADPNLEGPQHYEVAQSRPLPSLTRELENTEQKPLADTVDFEIIRVLPPNDDRMPIMFSFTNVGQKPIVLDPMRLSMTNLGKVFGTSVRKEPRRLIVEPGETHTGSILVSGRPEGESQLAWTLQELRGEGRELIVSETLDMPTFAR